MYFKGQLMLSSEEAIPLPDSACAKPSVESMVGWGLGEGETLWLGAGGQCSWQYPF